MKSIVVVNNSSKKISYLLNNLVEYEIDKKDHILRLHRIIDGDDVFDNIQLKDLKGWREVVGYGTKLRAFYHVENRMEEFLADDDESILDISEYVNQYVMMRDDDEEDNPSIFDSFMEQLKKDRALTTEEEDPGHCSQCGEHIDHMWQIAAITDDGEGNVKRYCSSDCLLAACNQDRLEAERELQKEEEDKRDDCTGFFSTRHFCPQFYDGKCNNDMECYWKRRSP